MRSLIQTFTQGLETLPPELIIQAKMRKTAYETASNLGRYPKLAHPC